MEQLLQELINESQRRVFLLQMKANMQVTYCHFRRLKFTDCSIHRWPENSQKVMHTNIEGESWNTITFERNQWHE